MVDRQCIHGSPSLIEECESAVLFQTGFVVKLRKKVSKLLVDALEAAADSFEDMPLPAEFAEDGNCIPAAGAYVLNTVAE
eukprot:10813071-Karenia_brevis.AAC.1